MACERRPARLLDVLAVSLGFVTACVDRDPGTPTGVGGAGLGGAGGGASPALRELSVRVVDPATGLALEAMPVAIELVGGARVELLTDATGHARATLALDEVESVITHRNNRSFSAASQARIERDQNGDGLLELESFTLVGLFHGENETAVAGSIIGAQSPDTRILVTQTGHGLVLDEAGATSYTTTAPELQPFSLVALEWEPVSETATSSEALHHAWVVASHPGVVVPTVLDLDFGASVAPTLLSGRVAVPASPVIDGHARLDVRVLSGSELDSSAWLGLHTRTAPAAEQAGYDFDVDYVDVPDDTPTTHYRLELAGGGYSLVVRPGLPAEGTIDPDFLVPPHRTAPTGAGPHAWSTPIEWQVEPGQSAELRLRYEVEGQAIGQGLVAPGETRFATPALPSASSFLPSATVQAVVELAEASSESGAPRRAAREASFELRSPLGD